MPDIMSPPLVLGWREWAGLPALGLPLLKAKLDTGARTSALHAFDLDTETDANDQLWVRFAVHPIQQQPEIVVQCRAPVIDQRQVSDSGGHREQRYVITTPLHLGTSSWPIELTLTNRDSMRFRMLIGRTALAGRALVDSGLSYALGQPSHASASYPSPTPSWSS
ncbi:ATP-dependent zinc protease [Rhabdochromatium marinum]|uniref:ATP-dependent zinc protease family protein n=1 Tax=Rhabdochromatium marinum TaxID=48729 RepID=UPI0019076C30|nr:RimK/LysX family protein [Rhabdochromatium marinum]MBK1647048.1 ATP-dependent zinc protease [Rhabdochromatium marinum]